MNVGVIQSGISMATELEAFQHICLVWEVITFTVIGNVGRGGTCLWEIVDLVLLSLGGL